MLAFSSNCDFRVLKNILGALFSPGSPSATAWKGCTQQMDPIKLNSIKIRGSLTSPRNLSSPRLSSPRSPDQDQSALRQKVAVRRSKRASNKERSPCKEDSSEDSPIKNHPEQNPPTLSEQRTSKGLPLLVFATTPEKSAPKPKISPAKEINAELISAHKANWESRLQNHRLDRYRSIKQKISINVNIEEDTTSNAEAEEPKKGTLHFYPFFNYILILFRNYISFRSSSFFESHYKSSMLCKKHSNILVCFRFTRETTPS